MRTIDQSISGTRWTDRLFNLLGWAALLLCLGVLAALLLGLVRDGWDRLNWDFLTSFPSRRASAAGAKSAIVGSALVMLLTGAAAIPLGIAAGTYLEEYARKNWFTSLIEINISNLAAVPSIIYGLMALSLLVYVFHFGQSILTGGLTLAFLILPIVIVATREALRAIPQNMREAAFALGATRWQVVKDHLLPYSTGGISTGVIIALSRAIGETAPLVTIGAITYIAFLPPAPFAEKPWLSAAISSAQLPPDARGVAGRGGADLTVRVRTTREHEMVRTVTIDLGSAPTPDALREAIDSVEGVSAHWTDEGRLDVRADEGLEFVLQGRGVPDSLGLQGGGGRYGATEWVWSPFTVLPIQMFNWVSRPDVDFAKNAAAAGVVLMVITLGMNGVAIAVRARMRRRIRW